LKICVIRKQLNYKPFLSFLFKDESHCESLYVDAEIIEEITMKPKQISKRRNTGLTASLIAGGLLLSASTLPAFATDFTVNSFDDLVDNNTGDGVCDAGGGVCTLRAAIMQANATTGADNISVPAGTYELTITGVDERCDGGGATACVKDAGLWVPNIDSDASMGDLDITDDLTITGAGSDVTTVRWADSPTGDNDPLSGDRIFHAAVTLTATEDIASVVIQGLTVENGEVGLKPTVATDVCVADNATLPSSTTYDPSKLNAYDIEVIASTCGELDADGKLSDLDTLIIIDQFRRKGGGIAVGGGYSVVTYDSTKVGQPPAVITGGENQVASVEYASLNDVVVINNWSGGDGGGVFMPIPSTISQSRISGNTSEGNGGGLYSEGNVTVRDTLIGKVFDADTAAAHPELTNGNYGENGGAIFFTGAPQTTLSILRSAINGNEAIGGAGIAAREAELLLTNTTLSGNTARDVGGGIIISGDARLQNVTVANNTATTPAQSGGAGLDVFSNGTFFLSNTLLSNNKFVYTGKPTILANCGCQGSNCVFESQGYNLEDGDTCNFGITDQVNTDPLLVALADNGGPTETHAIPHSAIAGGVDSPAVDAGNSDPKVCPNNDQRTYFRPADGNGDGVKDCDIGAFELSEITPDLQIANMVAPDSVTTGSNYDVTVTITNGSVDSDSSVVLVTNALPSIVTFVSASTTTGSCAEAGGVVTCTIGDLDGTSSVTVTLTLTASAAGDATVTASVTSTAEPDAGAEPNNSASVLTKIAAASSGGGGGGGFCSYQPNGRFDPVLPLMVLIGLIYLTRKRRV
jgi:CSLREA domain-containing protein